MAIVELTRSVRMPISVCADDSSPRNGLLGSWADGLGAISEFEVTCRGEPAASGYLVDITLVDRAIRDIVGPRIRERLRAEVSTGRATNLPRFLRECAVDLRAALTAPLVRFSYRPSPFRSITLDLLDSPMNAIQLTETFEFAAAHRLHLSDRSDAENSALFGKCGNAKGHGHNYRIEVAVSHANCDDSRSGFPVLEAIVQREIMARFDHKNLNLDCSEFATRNPSVENIAFICHQLLESAFAATELTLKFVRVWETEKTSCRYPA